MSKGEQEAQQPHERTSIREGGTVSRREFLKIAGLAGAAVGASAGLGGLLAACGEEETTTTTAGQATTTTAGVTTTAGATTTVSAGAETGREIKVGYITPRTGELAAFGRADTWCLERWQEYAVDGIVCGDGLNHPIKFEYQDTQSDSNRAAQVAGDLINNAGIDTMMCASTPGTTIPVGTVCEAEGCPCLSTDTPADAWFNDLGGDINVGFKWIYLACWSFYELVANSVDMWGKIPTNKKIACVWPNFSDGNAYRASFGPIIEDLGYTLVDAGPVATGNEDFTTIIAKFKKEGCEIGECILFVSDFTTFWKQCVQNAWLPKIQVVGIASLFASSMEAVGEIADGVTGTCWWHPTFPYQSSLTGESCVDLARDWQTRTGEQWQQPQEHYMLFEWLVDVLKRTKNVDDKEEIAKNAGTTKMDMSVVGPFDFTQPVDKNTPKQFPNVAPTPMCHGQWQLNAGKQPWDDKEYMFNNMIVGNAVSPQIPLQTDLKPIVLPS